MIFGYNTDVKSGDVVYHVQTEDRGEKNPVIDSVIYVKGRIVDRRRTPYRPGETTPERLQEMVKQQHRELVDSIRGETYVLPEDPGSLAAATTTVQKKADTPPTPVLELTNANAIDQDTQLVFRLRVRDQSSGRPLAGAVVRAVLGPGERRETRREAIASEQGLAEISFDPPGAGGGAVLFQAGVNGASEILKFRLLRREEE